MAVFDANLMLRSTTQTISSLIGGAAGYTGNWLTLGTTPGAPWEGLGYRAVVQTSAGSNTDTMSLIYEFSDDQSTVNETFTRVITGTEAGSGTSSGALTAPTVDFYNRIANKRKYVRLRITTTGTMNNFGTVTVGIDAGDFAALR